MKALMRDRPMPAEFRSGKGYACRSTSRTSGPGTAGSYTPPSLWPSPLRRRFRALPNRPSPANRQLEPEAIV